MIVAYTGSQKELKTMKKEQMIRLRKHTESMGQIAWIVVKSLSARQAKIVITRVIAPVRTVIRKISEGS